MAVTLQRWGNSLGIRLPRPLLDQLGLGEGAQLDVRLDGDKLVLARASRRPRMSELLEGMTPEDRPEEVDWGPPVGKEDW
jgi:antitoxin MazE